MRRASGNCSRTARKAGVAMTASPTQFGRKMAMFIHRAVSRRAQLLQEACRGKSLVYHRQGDTAAYGLDEIRADHIFLAVIGSLDQHIRTNGLDKPQRGAVVKHG